jgi:fatty-acyl-CoA synthase
MRCSGPGRRHRKLVNAFLEAPQIAHILQAAKTKVLIALGPRRGFDIWQSRASATSCLT